MSLDLRDITVCVIDTVNPKAAARALRTSMAHCSFGDAILFSEARVKGPFRTVPIRRLTSFDDYSQFCMKELPALTQTPYVLVSQWDGYVVNPDAWRPEFRDYDYIGARWTHFLDSNTVGNGGFSLRSRKLLDALTSARFPVQAGENEDVLCCRKYRSTLESDFGVRFAPESVAMQFSHENENPNGPTFGFHGMGNLWRYMADQELFDLFEFLDPYVFQTVHCLLLLANCHSQKKLELMNAAYAKVRECLAPEAIFEQLKDLIGMRDAMNVFGTCERQSLTVRSRRWLKPRNEVNWGPLSLDEPCPCGSGQIYQNCHGHPIHNANAQA